MKNGGFDIKVKYYDGLPNSVKDLELDYNIDDNEEVDENV